MEGRAVLTIAKSKKATKALKLKPASARRFRVVSGMVISHRVASAGECTLSPLDASLSSAMECARAGELSFDGQGDCLRESWCRTFRGVSHAQCSIAESRRKSFTDHAAVENEGSGSTPVPGVVPGVLAGHNARVNVDAGYPYFLPNLCAMLSICP